MPTDTATDTAVWIDDSYNRDHASNGVSRYGAYVCSSLAWFAECWDGTYDSALPVHFAATAWRVATGPVMAPGYVRYHRRILHTELNHSYWDGSLLAQVDVITPWPQPLQTARQWMDQAGRGWWRDWLIEFGDAYCEPSDEDLAKAPFLLTTASLRFTVPTAELPEPPAAWRGTGQPDIAPVVAMAQRAVAVAAGEINRVVWPVIQQLERH